MSQASLTSLVSGPEMGRVVAVSSVVEAVIPMISSPVYTSVLGATLDTAVPGAAFLVTAASMVLTTVIFTWLFLTRQPPAADVEAVSYKRQPEQRF